MKVYFTNDRWVFGDSLVHELPLAIETVPVIESGTVVVNGNEINVVNGCFAVTELNEGANVVKIDGVRCETLMCRRIKDKLLVSAAGADFRDLLPLIAELNALKEDKA